MNGAPMNQGSQQPPMGGGAPMGSMMHKPQKKSSVGPIIGIVLVIIVIVLGGLYFWGKRLADNDIVPPVDEAPLSESDEVSDIQADLDATDLDALDAEAAAIEAELQ